MTDCIFYCKTYESDVFKHLLDLLTTNITLDTVTWVIGKDGIHISFYSSGSTLMLDSTLNSVNFIDYRYTSDSPMSIGIPVNDIRLITKHIKSRCSMQIYIKSTDEPIIVFDIGNKGGIVRNIPYVGNVQLIECSIENTFNVYHVLSSVEFYNICKHVKKLEDRLTLQSLHDRIVINSISVLDSTVRHISYIESIQRHIPPALIQSPYPPNPIDVSHITTLSRMGKLSTVIQVYVSSRCIKFQTQVGALGDVTVCMFN